MEGDWSYSLDYNQTCLVLETQKLWGETTCRVWLPEKEAVVRIPLKRLKPLSDKKDSAPDQISYIAAGARIADALTQDVFLAPIESTVIPLPHQIKALSKALSGDRIRYLLADEVGLGKTIEAGLIMRELKLRGQVLRTLVIAPKGLVTQWVAEMQTHFKEEFKLIVPGDIAVYKKFSGKDNIWQSYHQIICPIDSVKPLTNRRGWSDEQVVEYNRERFEDLINAGWDLIIVDEAHRLGGSTDQVARYKLGQGLSEAAPYFLLLSATPHQGKTEAFHRLIALLDNQNFPDLSSISHERVKPYVLVFTEFVPTQKMIKQFLSDRGFNVVCLNGSMDMEERKKVQEAFSMDARLLISTDAGGEGLNLQFAHVVINYDIPWNPMRLEQRIGRVDRIGQKYIVRAVNFVFEDTVEHRVREVIEQKLAVILEEFGVDKSSDVLDSTQSGKIFDDLYIDTIANPDSLEDVVDKTVYQIKETVQKTRESVSIFESSEDLDPSHAQQLLTHPLPHWVERMTVSYLKSKNGEAEKKGRYWNLMWPDGTKLKDVAFTIKDAEEKPTSYHLTLEDPKIKGLTMRLPGFVPGQPVPIINLNSLSNDFKGLWSIWKISIYTDEWNRSRILPIFVSDSDKTFLPTARHIWDQLLTEDPKILDYLDNQASRKSYDRLKQTVEIRGQTIYNELVQVHRKNMIRDREKWDYAFSSRRKAIERIGLPQVRAYRYACLEKEECQCKERLKRLEQVIPEIIPILITRVSGGLDE
jgi:superfamily II DNA or RNA helicase